MRMQHPSHPGEFVKAEIVEPLGLTAAAAADVLGVPRSTLRAFLNGRSALSAAMALRIEKAFGVRMDTLMRMQSSYDVARVREEEADIRVARYRPAEAKLSSLSKDASNGVGTPISRKRALQISRRIIERAERERIECAEWEAERGIQPEEMK